MAKLKIASFLQLRDIEIDVKPFTILIGEQATGKSLIAKLVYYFESIIYSHVRDSLIARETLDAFENRLTKKFFSIFPRYAWKGLKLDATFYYDENTAIQLEYDNQKEELIVSADWLKEIYPKINEEPASSSGLGGVDRDKVGSLLSKYFTKFPFYSKTGAYFVPAGRAFLSNIEKNISALSSEKIRLDSLVTEFSAYFGFVKEKYENFSLTAKQEIEHILHGTCLNIDEEIWISYEKGHKIKLANASSGEQEIVPMLLFLGYVSGAPFSFFVEEPEAHLFPSTQKKVVDLLAKFYNFDRQNNLQKSFFLTTHSPYILTSLNNLITAKQCLNKENCSDKLKEKYKDIVIDFEDVSAYSLDGAKCISIMDKESKTIQAEKIDAVSDNIQEELSELMDCLYDE